MEPVIEKKDVRMAQMMPMILKHLASGQTVRFNPQGISMLPMIRQGIDTVELSAPPSKLKKYDLPLYLRDNDQYVLHRVVAAENGLYTCIGDNQFALEPGIRQDQILALVTAFYRGSKRYTTSHLGYRIYCRFWHFSRPVRHFWRRGIGWLRRHLKK